MPWNFGTMTKLVQYVTLLIEHRYGYVLCVSLTLWPVTFWAITALTRMLWYIGKLDAPDNSRIHVDVFLDSTKCRTTDQFWYNPLSTSIPLSTHSWLPCFIFKVDYACYMLRVSLMLRFPNLVAICLFISTNCETTSHFFLFPSTTLIAKGRLYPILLNLTLNSVPSTRVPFVSSCISEWHW